MDTSNRDTQRRSRIALTLSTLKDIQLNGYKVRDVQKCIILAIKRGLYNLWLGKRRYLLFKCLGAVLDINRSYPLPTFHNFSMDLY